MVITIIMMTNPTARLPLLLLLLLPGDVCVCMCVCSRERNVCIPSSLQLAFER